MRWLLLVIVGLVALALPAWSGDANPDWVDRVDAKLEQIESRLRLVEQWLSARATASPTAGPPRTEPASALEPLALLRQLLDETYKVPGSPRKSLFDLPDKTRAYFEDAQDPVLRGVGRKAGTIMHELFDLDLLADYKISKDPSAMLQASNLRAALDAGILGRAERALDALLDILTKVPRPK
jgi:hypothetical protein